MDNKDRSKMAEWKHKYYLKNREKYKQMHRDNYVPVKQRNNITKMENSNAIKLSDENKSNTDFFIERIIDQVSTVQDMEKEQLLNNVFNGIASFLVLLSKNPVQLPMIRQKYHLSEDTERIIRSLRKQNFKLHEIEKELNARGINISLSAITNYLVKNRNTVEITIPENMKLSEAMQMLRSNGYTFQMVADRLNKEGFRTMRGKPLVMAFVCGFFQLTTEQQNKDFRYRLERYELPDSNT